MGPVTEVHRGNGEHIDGTASALSRPDKLLALFREDRDKPPPRGVPDDQANECITWADVRGGPDFGDEDLE